MINAVAMALWSQLFHGDLKLETLHNETLHNAELLEQGEGEPRGRTESRRDLGVRPT